LASAAVGAVLVGRWMDRVGRRPGLVVGYLGIAAGAIAGAVSIRIGSYPGLLLGTVVFGAGTGAGALARVAVADMYDATRRGRAVGLLLAAGTVGAVGGPLLVPASRGVAEGLGVGGDLVPWAISVGAALVAVGLVAAVRPDPRTLARDVEGSAGSPPASRSWRELLSMPALRGALIAVVVAQMAMVGVMGVTPNALEHIGHGGATPWIISGHTAGMYAFAPFVGWALDRWGRRPGLLVGLGLTAVGAVVAGAGSIPPTLGVGLFAIGLGWSSTYLAVTAVISDVTRADERAGALGFADLTVSVCSAGAALAGGVVLDIWSYGALARTAAVLVTIGAIGVVVSPTGSPARRPA
jgi:MFS family permease